MRIYGLTGGIACGKSAASSILSDQKRFDIPLVDADVISRDVVEPGTWGLRRVVKAFGESVLTKDGTLDREKMGKMVFEDESLRWKLGNALGLPIAVEILRQIVIHWVTGETVCVLDAPTLYETKSLVGICTKIIVVSLSSEKVQLKRLMERDGLSETDARNRIRAQMPLKKKIQMCDIHLPNDGTREELDAAVSRIASDMKKDDFFEHLVGGPFVVSVIWLFVSFLTASPTSVWSLVVAAFGLVGFAFASYSKSAITKKMNNNSPSSKKS